MVFDGLAQAQTRVITRSYGDVVDCGGRDVGETSVQASIRGTNPDAWFRSVNSPMRLLLLFTTGVPGATSLGARPTSRGMNAMLLSCSERRPTVAEKDSLASIETRLPGIVSREVVSRGVNNEGAADIAHDEW